MACAASERSGSPQEGGVMAKISDREAEAVRAAISVGECQDPWKEPVHAIDRALRLSSNESRDLLMDLERRKLIKLRPEARHGEQLHLKARWTLGLEHPDAPKEREPDRRGC